MSYAEESTYQGRPTLTLRWKEDDKYPFSFGLGKAKLLLEHVQEIEEFVEKHQGQEGRGR